MNAIDLILNRRTYRGYFEEKPVPRENLIKIMEAGPAAPSGWWSGCCSRRPCCPSWLWCF